MKITEKTNLKVNTILKDNDGYFIVKDYDEQNDYYFCIGCNKFGTIVFEDEMYLLKIDDLIGVEIIKED